ncbi:hypothetical protein Cni_G25432 [Canna indica]|uniref:Uncharacterized protein n=1 Tax=Canna indica TaxID=4628 RepID=A0AAQ3KXP4_9LILI|nr:hypothetical protein Cni_G25432 [Canna indica]
MGNPGGAPASSKKGRHPKEEGGSSMDLHVAARNGDLRTVESICNANPLAINTRDGHLRTPLHLAAWSGQTELVRFLCKNKASVGITAMDDTAAIHFAAQKGHLEIVRILLSSGVSVNAANRKKMTPLHFAVQGSHVELIKYLIRKGASLTAKTKAGQTPIDLAKTEEIRSIVESTQPLAKGEKSNTTKGIAESIPKDSLEEKSVDSISKELADYHEGGPDINEKRKSEEATNEGSSNPKKTRVSLGHLLADNDELDEEE